MVNQVIFSIIIPIKNVENTIKNCLNSIVNQNIYNYEVLIVNDCSDDSSVEIVNEYISEYDNIRLIENTIHSGAGSCRNIAIKNSIGDFLLFIDGDDRFSNKFCLDILLKQILRAVPDVIVFNYTYFIENGGNRKNVPIENDYELKYWSKIGKNSSLNINTIDEVKDVLLFPAYPWNKIYRRKYIEDNGFTFSETICHNDLKFSWISLLFANNIVFLNNCIIDHRQNNDSSRLTNDKSINRFDLFVAFGELDSYLSEYPFSNHIISNYIRFSWDAFNWGKYKISKKYRLKYIIEYRRYLKISKCFNIKQFIENSMSLKEKIIKILFLFIPPLYYLMFETIRSIKSDS